MTPYKTLGKNSGVQEYEIGDTSIKVKFIGNPKIYVYNENKPGYSIVKRMKELALSGTGLSTYIATVVKKNYFKIES